MVMHDFNEISVFAAVVEQGGLTPVSHSMGLPKSTLSRRISQLEGRVGQRLLLRHSNRMVPTEAGSLFYDYCRQLMDLAEQSQQSLDDLREEVSGQLVLHVHNAFERGWLPAVVDGFLALHPGIHLELVVAAGSPDAGRGGIGDLWLWLGPGQSSSLRCEQLGRWETALYASPGYLASHGIPERPDQLGRHRWVNLLDAGSRPVLLQHESGREYLFTPAPSRLKANTLVLQADSLVRGQGIGVLPSWYASRYEQAHPGSFVKCLPEWQPASLQVGLHYSFGRPARKVSALAECLRREIPAEWID
ncbi:iron-regulated virulence regulatory protein IrgB [Halopseudomonas salina]|uniref:Iron-regulated virulence regulatory protein IrgB n=2 Tax=Halopseudomonas salina TaxID=1323744 RepID=A0ABQ1PSW1_9GAMM|nr:iron-regulated virulence regulatory protein IrgB [Halopseudomonas salina]